MRAIGRSAVFISAFTIVVLMTAGCDESATQPVPGLSGTWEGVRYDSVLWSYDTYGVFSMTFDDAGGGTAIIWKDIGSTDTLREVSFVHPRLAFVLEGRWRLYRYQFVGTILGDDRLEGTWSGPSLIDTTVTATGEWFAARRSSPHW